MKTHALEILDVLGRYRYVRTNFLAPLVGGSAQNRTRDLEFLRKQNKIILHPPDGRGDITRSYTHYFPRIHERNTKHERRAEHFWHEVLTCDILISIETACRAAGFRFRSRDEILFGRPLELPCSFESKIGARLHRSDRAVAPDGIFAINDTFFVLEADTGSEPVLRNNLEQSSYLRKFLQYRDVLKNKTYQSEWNIPNLIILNITTKADRKGNLLSFMENELKFSSRSMLFAAYPSLASTTKAPQPILSLLDDELVRAGHPPFIIRKEVINGHNGTKATPGQTR